MIKTDQYPTADYNGFKRRALFKMLCALIGVLIVFFALWAAGPAPSGF